MVLGRRSKYMLLHDVNPDITSGKCLSCAEAKNKFIVDKKKNLCGGCLFDYTGDSDSSGVLKNCKRLDCNAGFKDVRDRMHSL